MSALSVSQNIRILPISVSINKPCSRIGIQIDVTQVLFAKHEFVIYVEETVIQLYHCSNLTPPRGQRRRPRPRRHRRRRRRRFRENNARPDDVSPLLSSSKRNHFRLREKDHRLQRPRGPGDSRSLIHGEEDIDIIEGFDFRDEI